MLIRHNREDVTAAPGQSTFLWSYLRPYRLRLLAGIAAIIFRDLIAFTIPLLIRNGINTLIHAPRATAAASVAVVAGGIAIAAVPRFSFQTASRLSLMTTSRNVEFVMRRDLLRHFFRLDSSYWAKTRVGDAMAHATNDLNAVRMMVGPGASSLSECLAALPITVVVMASVNWRLTLVALLPTPLAILIVTRSGRIIRRRFEAIQSIFSTMSAAVQQTVSGVRVVRAFAQEKAEAERFDVMNRSYAAANRGLAVYSSSLDPLLVFTTGLSVAIVLCYGGLQVLEGQLSIGNFVMFTTYTALLSRPFASLGRAMNLVQRGRASVRRLHVLFLERPRITSPENGRRKSLPVSVRDRITLEAVTVRHGSLLALDQVMLDIPAGSTLAVFGATGSGKSTLARLMPRLVDPSEGRVLIDGVDIRSLDLEQLRSHIGLVPQESFLFSASVEENIAMGSRAATSDEVARAAELAGLAEDLRSFPAGLKTVVGERGIMLSGGQKQRIALARALLRQPDILVLDDALSSVDALTAQFILDGLRHATKRCTTIFIAHRVAAARIADQIVILDDGRIVESGTHGEVLARNGHYASMSRLQSIERELEIM